MVLALFNLLVTVTNMFQTYCKRPVPIQCVKWNKSKNTLDFLISNGLHFVRWEGHCDDPDLCRSLQIRTVDTGVVDVHEGDWICKRFDGKFFLSSKSVFEQTYEPYKE